MDEGGTKKFLYTGPKSKKTDNDDDKWQFIPQNEIQKELNLDDVWSIKRNVMIGNAQGDNRLTLNASKNYYSRYGGMKDNSTSSTNGQSSNPAPDNSSSWTNTRKAFSYSNYSRSNSDIECDPQKTGNNRKYRGMSNRGVDSHEF